MAYTITPLRLEEHRDALARLWAENMSDGRIASAIPERMRWLYAGGPAGTGATTVLCVDSATGAAVGCGSFFERATWVDGHRVRAGVLFDFAVTAAHRVGGAALAIQRALVEAAGARGLELLFGHPNARSLAIFKRVGYRVVGETTAWVKPLRAVHRLRRALRSDAAGTVAALPVDAALLAFDCARRIVNPVRVRSGVLPRADARADALWDRARGQYAVEGEQSSEYLDWRYGRFGTVEHHLFGVFPRDGDHLLGLAVYALDGRRAVLSDLLAEDARASARAMLLHLAAHVRSLGAESLSFSYVGPPGFGAQLPGIGFLPLRERRPLVVYPLRLEDAVRARVMDPASWFMLEGELDL